MTVPTEEKFCFRIFVESAKRKTSGLMLIINISVSANKNILDPFYTPHFIFFPDELVLVEGVVWQI